MKKLIGKTNQRLIEVAHVSQLMANYGLVLTQIAEEMIKTLRRGRTVYLFGNGGSAADAQHIAAELVGRFQMNKRRPLPAVSLTTNTSLLTSIANDYGYVAVFARQVLGLVKKGDLVIAFSTSGNSASVLEGIKAARRIGVRTIGFTGQTGGKLKRLVNLCFCAPSKITARIQECHITAGHIICELIEDEFSSPK